MPAERLVQVVEATLRHAGAADGEVTLVIANDELLHQLNLDYRGIDAPTDVLSFAAQEEAEGQAVFVSAPEALNYLGDVIISFPTAERQAAADGHSVPPSSACWPCMACCTCWATTTPASEEEADMWARQSQILASLPPLS